MKIRALIWDTDPASGVQSRRGPPREHTNGHQAQRDLDYLKTHCREPDQPEIVDERHKHYAGPTDPVFEANPAP